MGVLIGFLTFLFHGIGQAPPAQAASVPQEETATRLVLKVAPTVDRWLAQQRQLLTRVSARVVARIEPLRVVVVRVPAERAQDALRLYRRQPDVLYAEFDQVAQATFTPNDPFYATHQYALPLIRADQAWDLTRGNPNLLVAVLDTGADFTHPDLAGKLVPGWDFVNNDPDPADDNGHGTHVAGIIAAATHNGEGIAGVAFNTRVLVVKVLNAQGSGFYSTIAQGIVFAADQGARILNLSLRGTVPSNVLADAVAYAQSKGALLVAAAGNDGQNTPVYPAAYPGVLAVAATDWNDQRWSLSNYGDYVDLAAPGVAILSTDWTGGVGPYAMRSGTSIAAPHVAGVAALMLAVNPNLTAADLAALLTSTAEDLGDPGRDPYYGYGRLDAARAVQAALAAARTQQTATVGDRVWLDANGNGLQDAGEPGVEGITVRLVRADGTPVASTTTDAEGKYTFTDVEPGDYYLTVDVPADYRLTRPDQGTDDAQDSDVDPTTRRTPVFTLNAGDVVTTWDIGLVPTGRLGGLAWLDVNANGVQDAGEGTVVPGVPVRITGTNVLGETVDTTVQTDTGGRYLVEGLLPGTYTVEAPYRYSGYVLTTPGKVTVMLTASVRENTNVNFGYIAPTWVTLLTFTATPGTEGVTLRWDVALTGAAPGFHVWRSEAGGREERLTDTPLLPVWENGIQARYRFVDTTATPGKTYTYRLSTVTGSTFGPWTVTVPEVSGYVSVQSLFLPYMTR